MDREEKNPQDGVVAIVIIPENSASTVCEANEETSLEGGLNLNPQTVVVIDSDGAAAAAAAASGELGVKNKKKDLEMMNIIKSKMLKPKVGKGFNEEWNGERVCRICHLGSNQVSDSKPGTSTSELIQLGCDCKHELGSAHTHCAEAWFKLKGNRTCEICGETARNVEGVGDNRFMEEWNEGRSVDSNGNTSNMGGGCWRGQTFCNFLMACLVIAFVLPWFFRINIF